MSKFYCSGREDFCDRIRNNECEVCEHGGAGGWWSDDNPYWDKICAMAERQRLKGLIKYSRGLEDNPMVMIDRLEYLQEELIDGLMYIEHIKAKLTEDFNGD